MTVTPVSPATGRVFIIDDDQAVVLALETLVQSLNLQPESFSSAMRFLEGYSTEGPSCAIVDVRMPGMSGLELLNELNRRNIVLPVIIISGHADVPMAVDAMKRGAITILEKPFQPKELCDQIHRALQYDAECRAKKARRSVALEQVAQLSSREREVLERVTAGYTNNDIARQLGLSVRAIEERRARMMEKLQVKNLAELIELVSTAEGR